MFKTIIFLSLTLCILNPLSASNDGSADTVKTTKHTIGIQLNPLLGKYTQFDPISNFYTLKSAIRYGYNFKPSLTAGAEFLFSTSRYSSGNFYAMGPGIYGRYWFMKKSWISLGAEINGFMLINKYNELYEVAGAVPSIDKISYSYFFSPIISLKKPSSRWSLDLMYKFTHESYSRFSNGPIFSYRLNYNF